MRDDTESSLEDLIEKAKSRIRKKHTHGQKADKAIRYAEAYAMTNNSPEAAKVVGCSRQYARSLLDDPLVEDLVNLYREREFTAIDAAAIRGGKNIGQLDAMATRDDILCAQAKRILLSRIARGAVDLGEFKSAISAVAELNKMDGDLAPTKSQVDAKVQHEHDLSGLSATEIDAEIAKLQKLIVRH